jgi:hypothetical protein
VESDRAQDVFVHRHELVGQTARLLSRHHRAQIGDYDLVGSHHRAEEDLNYYEIGTTVSDAELAAVPRTRHDFHGDWNYTIAPSNSR